MYVNEFRIKCKKLNQIMFYGSKFGSSIAFKFSLNFQQEPKQENIPPNKYILLNTVTQCKNAWNTGGQQKVSDAHIASRRITTCFSTLPVYYAELEKRKERGLNNTQLYLNVLTNVPEKKKKKVCCSLSFFTALQSR